MRIFLNPYDPDVIEAAREAGYTDDWIEAAQRSPVYKLAVEQKIALPLHPEYRTLPMVWYVPPLSPIMGAFDGGLDDIHPHVIFPAIDQMRIPIEYLANLLAAGDTEVIRTVLKKMVAMRSYMRAVNLGKEPDRSILEKVGMDEHTVKEMYKLSAVAKYSDRYVIPSSHREKAGNAFYGQGTAGYAFMESCSGCSEYDAERFYSFDWGDEDGRASETI